MLKNVDEVKTLGLIVLEDVFCCEEMIETAMLRGRLLTPEIAEEFFLLPWPFYSLGAHLV